MGEIHELDYNTPYIFTGIPQKGGKYGVTYRIISYRRNKPKTQQEVYTFLKSILTSNQADVLYKEYPDIIERVTENKPVDLSRLKGIGEATFVKIKDKIIENFMLLDLINEFKGCLSLSLLRQMYDKYTNIEIIRSKIIKDPYKFLCELSGVGFKTADEILLNLEKTGSIKFEYDLKTSLQRCISCISYCLRENENNGSTRIELVELSKHVKNATPECFQHFVDASKNPMFYVGSDDHEETSVSLVQTYNVEKYIYNTIKNSTNIDNKWHFDIEKYRQNGDIKLTDTQLSALENLNKYNFSILAGSAGCVDCDTEYFNGTQWVPISKYQLGDKVLQYNEDGTAELVYPEKYIKQPSEYLWHFKTKNGLDQCLSLNHMCYYETRWGVRKKEPFYKIKEKQESKTGFTGKFFTSFKYNGTGISLSDDEIRLMVAVFADGCYVNDKKDNYVRVNVKKQRKIDRLVNILNKLNKKYCINKAKDGYTKIHFHVNFYAKHFPSSWYNCSQHQFEVIADEVMYWDGTFSSRERFATVNKNDADFIQFAFSVAGYRSSIQKSDMVGDVRIINGKKYTRKRDIYTVSRTKLNMPSMSVETRKNKNFGKTKILPYKTKDGFEYCFTVPGHLLVLRRNNKIFITGNCGKSQSVKSIIDMLDDNNKTYTLLAPTGKAAKTLSSYVNRDCQTIHMGLGFIPPDQWSFNETNKIKSDVIIVDESSMIDIFLFKRLISAIDFQRTKLLLIGDPAQLPSVSCGNLLHDLLALKFVKRTMLTEVFRYGEGGLMKVATDVRNCKQYIDKMDGRTKVFGDNKDYIFMNFDKQSGLEVLLQTYKTALQKYDVKDVSVLMAYRKGEFGTVNVNKMLQKIANKNARENNEEYVEAKGTKFYVGDIVMQTRNNREARLVREEQFGNNEIYYEQSDTMVMIANGESGVIEVIQDGLVVINFNGLRIAYEKKDMQDVDLGFSCTVHKCVTANTFIYTNKGLKRLGELNPGLNTIGKIKINDDTKVYNGKYLEKPSYFINAGRQPCINIVTKKNFTITGTYDHGIDVLTKDCNIVRKNLEEVTKDDFVVIAKNNNVKVEENLELPKEWSNIDLNVRAKVFKLPQKMTEEFAEFLGMMVADGVLAHSGIRYGKNQVESVLRFRDLGYELFGYKVDSNFKHLFEDGAMGGMYTYEIASMHILQYCKNMEFLNPNHKYIPKLIINADEKYQACFLRGIFEDGTVNIKGDDKHFDHIELVMADKNIIETIRMMLLNMGIVSTMCRKKNQKHYILYIYREYAQVYAEKIGFICRMKQDRLKKCFKPIISGEGLPYVDDVIRKIVANNRLVFKKKMPRLYNRLYKYRTPVYSVMLKEFVDNFKDKLANDEDFRKLQYISNYCFIDSVKEINKTEDEVYCLEMPETHKFVQNGFYGWNCQGSQNKIIILFTPSSHTYMLNSNLLYVGLTRMQEKVFHIGDLKTVNNAVLKKENLERNTWLRNFKSN